VEVTLNGLVSDGQVWKLLVPLPNTSFHENGAADGTDVGDADGASDGVRVGASLGVIEGESDGAIPNNTSPITLSNVSNFLRPFKNFFNNVGSTCNLRPYALLSVLTIPFFLDFRFEVT
jgi:hypothetical protein